uniref:protein-tyrosine-phosphatase n=1 Tax=Panagrellus redivivus TaxID=6233 RepID=A0A7E4ZSH2_PANRE
MRPRFHHFLILVLLAVATTGMIFQHTFPSRIFEEARRLAETEIETEATDSRNSGNDRRDAASIRSANGTVLRDGTIGNSNSSAVRRVPPYFTVKLQNVYRVGIGASINLTCVAVGYPMPRVFWKRKSDDYFLNDPETAPFGKNVLTLTNVDRTDNYTCIAVSKLGNIEVSTTVEAKPLLPAPKGVKIVDSKDCNVRIRWDAVSEVSSEDPLQSYIVKYRQKYTERGGVFKEHKVPPSQTSAIIEGLEPYTQYEFIVVGVSNLGRGQPALPVESQTAESLPISPPAEVKARPLNSQAVLVQWSPPNNPNGRIIGYEVYFTNKPLSDEADKTGWQKKDFKSDELMATLSGLDPEKTYYIQIRARNAKGVGPFSKTVTVITKQGVPGQPSKLTAKAVDARRIALAWEKPLHSFNIVGYTIRFNVSRTETKELLLTSNVQKHTVDGLRPSTTYSFRVAAHSDRGQGVFGDEISATTMPIDAFVFPLFTVSRANLSTVLTINFGEIQSNKSIFIEYRLGKEPENLIQDTSSYEEEDISEDEEIEGSGVPEIPDKHEFWTRVPIDDADQSKLDVHGLRANTLYEIRLSGGGNSTSESILFKTPEDVTSKESSSLPFVLNTPSFHIRAYCAYITEYERRPSTAAAIVARFLVLPFRAEARSAPSDPCSREHRTATTCSQFAILIVCLHFKVGACLRLRQPLAPIVSWERHHKAYVMFQNPILQPVFVV